MVNLPHWFTRRHRRTNTSSAPVGFWGIDIAFLANFPMLHVAVVIVWLCSLDAYERPCLYDSPEAVSRTLGTFRPCNLHAYKHPCLYDSPEAVSGTLGTLGHATSTLISTLVF